MKATRHRSSEKEATLGKSARGKRIDLSGCKLVAPYGRDLHAPEALSTIATKMGGTKGGLRKIVRED